jgi:hypothetical protein
MIIIGFGLTHFWLIVSATMDVVSARRWLLGLFILAVFFLLVALFTHDFRLSRSLPRALTSPMLVMAVLGLLTGFLARTTVNHLQDWRSTLVYGLPALLLVLVGLFSKDVTTLMRRFTGVQTQYISLSFSPEITAKPTPEMQYPWTQAFKGQPFSMGVQNLSALIGVPLKEDERNKDNNGALQRDLAFIESCVLPSTLGEKSRCPQQLQSSPQEATNLRQYIDKIKPLTDFQPLAKCLADHADLYPNGLPIQADLYNLSADLVRSVMQLKRCETPSIDPWDLQILQSKAREDNAENPFEKDDGLSTDRLLLEHIYTLTDEEAKLKAADSIEFAKLRADARQHTKMSFRNVVRELRSQDCIITDEPELLERWRQMPDNPYKMIMVSYLVAASGYPEEAILSLIKFMDEKEQQGCLLPGPENTIVAMTLKTRMLQVLNAMMEHNENYKGLVYILDEIVKDYKAWLDTWSADVVIKGEDEMERICGQREEYGEMAEFPQRYVAAYLNAKTRLVYFLGKHEPEMLEEIFWRNVAEETAQELLGYALSNDPLERLGIKKKGITKCFPYPADAYPSDWSKFRRDALLAAAYGKIALARLTEEDGGGDSRAADDLIDAQLALLDAKQLTEELRQEESKEHAKVAKELGTHQKLVVAIDAEKRNLSEITQLLDRLRSF